MPLARIFTHHPERTTSLSEELRQQGYQVEVRNPDQTHLAPADLEIEFEICDRADVLQRAASLAEELHADVAVAPGVLEPTVQSAAAPIEAPAQLSTETLPNETPAAQPGFQHERDPEREFEAAFAAQQLPTAEQLPQVIEIPVMEREPLPPVAFMDEPVAMRPEPVTQPVIHEPYVHGEAARQADPVPYLAQLMPFGSPSNHPQEEESDGRAGRDAGQSAPSNVMEAKAAANRIRQGTASFFSKAMAEASAMSSSAMEGLRERFQEYKKRAQVRSAEAKAARVARMLDLEQRKAEAQQRATELEAAREVASARLVELIRQRDPGLSEEDRKAEPFFKPLPYRTPVESLRHASISRMQASPHRQWSPQLRAVLTGAAAVSVLFVIGIVLGELYPGTPQAKPANHSSNGVTLQGSGVSVQTGGATVKNGPPAQPAIQPQAQKNSAGATVTSQTAEQNKPSPRVNQAKKIAAQQGESTIGDDVVIRHYSRPMPTEKPKQSGQQAGLKHFSDLEN